MDIDLFRETFPAFSDESKYPEEVITPWATIGEQLLTQSRWDILWTLGVQLYVAHNLTIDKPNPTQMLVTQSSKTLAGESISTSNMVIAEKNAGLWNTTTYGQRLFQLMKVVGMGATVV
jgi:hypothetical protein